jgi:ribosomal protein S19
MSRSKWKGPFVNNTLLNKVKLTENKKEIQTKSRGSTVLPSFVGRCFKIHNGKIFHKVLITEKMIGHKLGEFSPTRKQFSYKKTNKK